MPPKICELPNPADGTPALPPWKRAGPSSSSSDLPQSDLLSRISTFLPQLQAAQAALEADIAAGRGGAHRLERDSNDDDNDDDDGDGDGDEQAGRKDAAATGAIIEMDLALGVLEEKRARGTKRRREGDVRFAESSDEEEEEEKESSDDEDDDDEDSDDDEEGDDSDEDMNGGDKNSRKTTQDAEKRKTQRRARRKDKKRAAQEDVLAALLNIDAPKGSTQTPPPKRPGIEVVEETQLPQGGPTNPPGAPAS